MLLHPVIAPADKCPDGGGGGVKDVDAMVFDDLPEPVRLRPVRRAFVHESGSAIRQRSVDHITVPSDPTHIGGAPENVVVLNVEHVFGGGINPDQISAGGVQNTLRF